MVICQLVCGYIPSLLRYEFESYSLRYRWPCCWSSWLVGRATETGTRTWRTSWCRHCSCSCRGFGGWVSAKSRTTRNWGTPWRALGPSPCAAIPLTLLWTIAIVAHIAMLAFCIRSLMNFGCSSRTCIGVAAAQLAVSITTLAAAVFLFQLDLRFDAAFSPPRQSDANICTAVSMVPLTSVAINSGNSGDGGPEGSPLSKEKIQPPDPPT
ncbi:uncharacterized protein LOC124535457 isoform X2 [Vanessa cardui]|uniref:uncharacterized protein LOC124535457 isoform X2 n=1 Tax=Vanessa cardui TaxID=171605 RepID=UPI001F12A0C8|nr:uncharacterized protein LOC124535457 isoform X2 [Vanessa cardui]